MPPFLFPKLRFCTKKVAHYGALFFKLLTLGYVKTYRRLYTEDKPDENRLARHTFVSIGVVQASRKIQPGYSEYDKNRGQGMLLNMSVVVGCRQSVCAWP